jgi:hypothetical protein
MESHSMYLRWTFPLFTVRVSSKNRIVCVDADGKACVLLFKNRELAELYAEQAHEAQPNRRLAVLEVVDEEVLDSLLSGLPPQIDHVLWDATYRAQVLKLSPIRDVLAQLDEQQE